MHTVILTFRCKTAIEIAEGSMHTRNSKKGQAINIKHTLQ